MLILTRRIGESIVIGDAVTVSLVSASCRRVRLGIVAPQGMPVRRQEAIAKQGDGSGDSSEPSSKDVITNLELGSARAQEGEWHG